MRATALLSLSLLPGCLWIGPSAHDTRKAEISPAFELLDVTPDAFSACGEDPVLTVVGRVAVRHAGRSFETWHAFADGERIGGSPAVASADGSVVFDVALGTASGLAEGCPDRCQVPIVVGVEHLGFADEADAVFEVVGAADPVVTGAMLSGAAQLAWEDRAGALLADPPSALSAVTWPTLSVGLRDPHAAAGIPLQVSIAACPDGVDPTTGTDACVVVPAAVGDEALEGDVVVAVPTAGFAALACSPEGLADLYRVFVLVEQHPCAPLYALPLDGDPLRFVIDDCDADGFTTGTGDCADADPTRGPAVPEVWYDGIDSDCDGADDYDRDGDGVRGGGKGEDCDDQDPLTYPGAVEICDDADNDCNGEALVDAVTVWDGIGIPQLYTGLAEALADAYPGDEVRICPGTYIGDFLVSEDLDLLGSGSTQTTLRPATPGRPVLDLIGAVTVHVEGVELTGAVDGGANLRGGGVRAPDAVRVELEDVVITGNAASVGGGVSVGGELDLRDSVIAFNSASGNGGGLDLRRSAVVNVVGSMIEGNTALEGGGIACDECFLTFDAASRVVANQATRGGGILLLDDAEVTGGVFEANVAIDGGGFYAKVSLDQIPAPVLDGVTLRDHTDPSIARGGAGYGYGSELELYLLDSVVEGNAAGEGGGIYVFSGGPDLAMLAAVDTTFSDNVATGSGGGIYSENAYLFIYDGAITGNRAADGGGVYADYAYFAQLETTISGNTATNAGGGLYLFNESILYNYYAVTLDGNSAARGGAAYVDDAYFISPDATVTNNTATAEGGAFFLDGATGYGWIGGAGTMSGNSSGDGQTNAVWVPTGDSFISCSSVVFTDTVGCASDPAIGVPTNSCFTLDPGGITLGACDYCP